MTVIFKIIKPVEYILKQLVLLSIKAYRYFISPLILPSCRYYPTCSHYAMDALKQHGLAKGLLLTIIRIFKCNPFSRGGHDPVPKKFNFPK